MKCPLTQGYIRISAEEESYAVRDCLKRECAWWDEDFDQCFVLSVSESLWSISGALKDILFSLPDKKRPVEKGGSK